MFSFNCFYLIPHQQNSNPFLTNFNKFYFVINILIKILFRNKALQYYFARRLSIRKEFAIYTRTLAKVTFNHKLVTKKHRLNESVFFLTYQVDIKILSV